jgi:hypothetical protein
MKLDLLTFLIYLNSKFVNVMKRSMKKKKKRKYERERDNVEKQYIYFFYKRVFISSPLFSFSPEL